MDRWLAYILIGAIRMQGDEWAYYSTWGSRDRLFQEAFSSLRKAYL